MPSWAITSHSYFAVGESAGAFSVPAKLSAGSNNFFMVYGSRDGAQT